MWQEWLQQKPRVANSCAEENWSSVPEQYKMLKCVKAALPLIITLILDRGYSVCCAPGFIRELLDPQCVYSELQQQQCSQHLGWLFHKQLDVVVNRPFFFQSGLLWKPGWNCSGTNPCSFCCGLSTLWKVLCLPSAEQHFYPFTFMGWSKNFVFLFC